MRSVLYRIGLPLVLTMGTMTVYACAHQSSVDRKVEQELKEEPSVTMGGPMAAHSYKMIAESPNLSEEQKSKLLALHSKMAGEVASIREQEAKLKMLFFKTLLNEKSEEAEIANIKRRILALDRKKTNRMLNALEETREILGRKNPDSERLYRAFSMESRGLSGDLF